MQLSNVDASRLLFGFTAAYHFLFVPLTIGLMALISLFEGLALCTGRTQWREAARFYSMPFLINFICGIVTGYPLRLQVEANWAGYAQVATQVFASVFAFEAWVAPVMGALVLAFILGWRMKPVWHWLVSTALAVVLIIQSSAILMLNAWMQKPMGVEFVDGNAHLANLWALAANPLVVPKILHTVAGGWVLGGMFVVATSAWFLLKGLHIETALASLKVASRFVMFSLLVTGCAGHWSGERLVQQQPMKFAAIEALWETDGRSPDLVLFGLPDAVQQTNHFEIVWPGALGWIISADEQPLRSLRELTANAEYAIRQDLSTEAQAIAEGRSGGMARYGYAALVDGVAGIRPSDAQIEQAARRALPNVPRVFWAFRAMLWSWAAMLLLMLVIVWRTPDPARRGGHWALVACLAALPLPWIAIEAGWMVCEAGRQPWTITGVLLTRDSIGTVPAANAVQHLLLSMAAGLLLLGVNIACQVHHWRRGLVSDEVAAWWNTPVPWLRKAKALIASRRQEPLHRKRHHLGRAPQSKGLSLHQSSFPKRS